MLWVKHRFHYSPSVGFWGTSGEWAGSGMRLGRDHRTPFFTSSRKTGGCRTWRVRAGRPSRGWVRVWVSSGTGSRGGAGRSPPWSPDTTQRHKQGVMRKGSNRWPHGRCPFADFGQRPSVRGYTLLLILHVRLKAQGVATLLN